MKKMKKENEGIWKEFWHLLISVKLPWFWILLGFLCNMFYSQVSLLLPTTTAGLLSGSTDQKVLWDAILFYITFTIVLCGDILLRCPAQFFAVRNARTVLWNRMLHVRMDYYDVHNPSELMSMITNDSSEAIKKLVFYIIGFIPAFYYVVKALSTISTYSIWLMLALFLLLPIKVVYMIYVGKQRFKTQKKLYEEIGGLTGYLAERVRNLALIKTYTNEPLELKKGEQVARGLFSANMKIVNLECLITALGTGIGLIQNLIVMVFGVFLLQKGEITMQQWVAFFMFSGTVSNSFDTLISYWTDIKTIQGSLSRASRMMKIPTEEKLMGTESLGTGDIVFSNVGFSYGDKKVLDQISFTIKQGTTTAIVGLCGSGKTTLISLLENFYQPEEGTITFGGTELQKVSVSELRSKFGYVQQGAEFFGGSIREALTYGILRTCSDEEIMEAAKKTGFSQVISQYKEGLEGVISVGGTSLSGGQRQKLVLTRELLRNAEMLLLDEPTSALDVVATKEVCRMIFDDFVGKTKLIITHDLSLLTRMDQIIVLEGGSMVGCGTFEELKQTCIPFQILLQAAEEKEV